MFDKVVYVPSRFLPVGCGRPGPVFGPVVQYFLACGGAKCHTGLLLWLCRHPKLSTVWLAGAVLLWWGKGFLSAVKYYVSLVMCRCP